MKKETNGLELALALLLSILLTIFRGVVLASCWNWFLATVITQIPEISVGQAIGISFALSIFMENGRKSDDETGLMARVIGTAIGYLLFWGIAFIVHLIIQ